MHTTCVHAPHTQKFEGLQSWETKLKATLFHNYTMKQRGVCLHWRLLVYTTVNLKSKIWCVFTNFAPSYSHLRSSLLWLPTCIKNLLEYKKSEAENWRVVNFFACTISVSTRTSKFIKMRNSMLETQFLKCMCRSNMYAHSNYFIYMTCVICINIETTGRWLYSCPGYPCPTDHWCKLHKLQLRKFFCLECNILSLLLQFIMNCDEYKW